MRRNAVLDLILLEADDGLSPAEAHSVEEALAGDPSLQAERASIHAAWRELQALGSGVAMAGESGDAEGAAYRDSDALELLTTSTRRAPINRDHLAAPARRRRRSLRKRR